MKTFQSKLQEYNMRRKLVMLQLMLSPVSLQRHLSTILKLGHKNIDNTSNLFHHLQKQEVSQTCIISTDDQHIKVGVKMWEAVVNRLSESFISFLKVAASFLGWLSRLTFAASRCVVFIIVMISSCCCSCSSSCALLHVEVRVGSHVS